MNVDNSGSGRGYFGKRSTLAPIKDNYARQDHRVEYQLFGSEYFSGADVKLYFGDIWVDEITNFGFQLQESVMPIYGYNSFTFDAVARGQRTISGQFSMNFTSAGYLHQIMANANAIFYALEKGEKKGIIQPSHYNDFKLDVILKKLGKQSFDQIADEYEKAIWGNGESDEDLQLNYADMPYFRQDQLGFDVRVQYGAVAETSSYSNGKFYQSEKVEQQNTSVDVLNGVQLTGMAKTIGTDQQGAPLQESYSFIARDLNGISFAHLQRQGLSTKQTAETSYRNMQYGVGE